MADDLLLDSFNQGFLGSLYRWSLICPLRCGYFMLGAHFSNPSVENGSEGCPLSVLRYSSCPNSVFTFSQLKPDSVQKITEREVLGRRENEDQACFSSPCQAKPNRSSYTSRSRTISVALTHSLSLNSSAKSTSEEIQYDASCGLAALQPVIAQGFPFHKGSCSAALMYLSLG